MLVIVYHLKDEHKKKSLQGLFLWKINKAMCENTLQLQAWKSRRKIKTTDHSFVTWAMPKPWYFCFI